MNSIYIIILLFLVYISKKVWKELYNPQFLFVGFWTLIMFLSSLNLYNQNSVHPQTYSCVMLGIVAFACGGFFIHATIRNSTIKRNICISNTNVYKIPSFVYTISLIVCIILFTYFLRTMTLIFSGTTLDYVRSNFVNLVIHSNIERLLWSFVVFPISLAVMSIDLYAYFVEGKKSFIVLSLLLTIFVALTSGGRVYFFFFLLQVVYFTLVSGKKINFKNLIVFGLLILISVQVVSFISSSRQIETSQMESLYVYYTGCFPLMELKIAQVDLSGFNSYGLAFFNAPITFFEMLFKNLGIIDYSSLFVQTNDVINSMQEYEDIGSAKINAFVSLFFAFYLDGGLWGVFFGSFLFGCFCIFIFEKIIITRKALFIVLYAVILNAIFTSFVRWQLGRLEFFLSLFYVWLLLRNHFTQKLHQ